MRTLLPLLIVAIVAVALTADLVAAREWRTATGHSYGEADVVDLRLHDKQIVSVKLRRHDNGKFVLASFSTLCMEDQQHLRDTYSVAARQATATTGPSKRQQASLPIVRDTPVFRVTNVPFSTRQISASAASSAFGCDSGAIEMTVTEDVPQHSIDNGLGTPNASLNSPLFAHQGAIDKLVVSADGTFLVSASGRHRNDTGHFAAIDNSLKLWSLPDGKLKKELVGHRQQVTNLAISSDGLILASGSSDDEIRIWSLPEGNLKLVIHPAPANQLPGVEQRNPRQLFLSDKQKVLLEITKTGVTAWSLIDGSQVKTTFFRDAFHENIDILPTSVAVSSDGRTIVIGGPHLGGPNGWPFSSLSVWSLSDGKLIKQFPYFSNQDSSVLALSADGRTLISGGSEGLLIWDMKSADIRWWIKPDETGTVLAAALTPDGRHVITASIEKGVILWSLEDGRLLRTVQHSRGGITAASLSADGRLLFTGDSLGVLKVWCLVRWEIVLHVVDVNVKLVPGDEYVIVFRRKDKPEHVFESVTSYELLPADAIEVRWVRKVEWIAWQQRNSPRIVSGGGSSSGVTYTYTYTTIVISR